MPKDKKRTFTAEVEVSGRATFTFEWSGDEDPTNEDAWDLLMQSNSTDDNLLEWNYEQVTGVSEDE